jgi:hypothetical protein
MTAHQGCGVNEEARGTLALGRAPLAIESFSAASLPTTRISVPTCVQCAHQLMISMAVWTMSS